MNSVPPALQDLPEACHLLYRHWDEIRGEALLPRRAQLDPSKLVAILPRLQIVELLSRRVIRCKLVGTGLRNIFGFDFTGRNYIELAPPDAQRIRSYRHWIGVEQPCGCIFGSGIPYASGAVAPVIGIGVPLLPDQEGGAPMMLTVTAQEPDRGWINEQSVVMIGLPERFEFFDIGAGIPPSTYPPEDWRMEDD